MEELYAQAEEQMAEKEYKLCIATMNDALRLDPDNRKFAHEHLEAERRATSRVGKGSLAVVLLWIVYDAITLISEALSDGIESRTLVKEGLMRIELSQSLTNGTGFNEKRQFNRKLLIMEIGSKSIRKWAQPED